MRPAISLAELDALIAVLVAADEGHARQRARRRALGLCAATTVRGTPCASLRLPGSRYCYAHGTWGEAVAS